MSSFTFGILNSSVLYCFLQFILCVVAHARLMFRNEVEQLDAIAAILCIESSMTTSAKIDGTGDALHSEFTDKPDEECILKALFGYSHSHMEYHGLDEIKSFTS